MSRWRHLNLNLFFPAMRSPRPFVATAICLAIAGEGDTFDVKRGEEWDVRGTAFVATFLWLSSNGERTSIGRLNICLLFFQDK